MKRGVASSAIDLSDGLLGDLDHILELSGVGAEVDETALPLAPLIAACGDPARAFQACTAGGDDYELLFTAPADAAAQVLAAGAASGTPVSRIGRITSPAEGLRVRAHAGAAAVLDLAGWTGFDHFRSP